MLDFENLSAMALSEWPAELRLAVRQSETGHQVEGLADLERGISRQWSIDPRAILMRTLHWNILRAVHLAFAHADVVDMAEIPSVRVRFEEDLKILATSLHVTEADRLTIRSYLAASANDLVQSYVVAARRETLRERASG